MFSTQKSSAQPTVDGSTDRSPRRRKSADLLRIKNFGSTLSLRKQEPDTPPRSDSIPTSSTFSRLKALSQSRTSRGSLGNDQADTSAENKASRRTSRLLDAFKPSKKPTPSFEVVRKPPNRSTASLHSSNHHHSSPQIEQQRPASRLSVHRAPDVLPEPAPTISLSAAQSDPQAQPPIINAAVTASGQSGSSPRSPYPPSTTKTRRLSSNLTLNTGRNAGSASNSRTHSPLASPLTDPANGSFNLHSFHNVRSASETSHGDEALGQPHSRVQSMISVEEYATPGEELPEPRFVEDAPANATLDKFSEAARAQSTSPVANSRPTSMSAAKFRQASRQRSESGNFPTLDGIQGNAALPTRSRTPSQDLVVMEAVLAQTRPQKSRTSDHNRRKSADPALLAAAAVAPVLTPTADEPQRRKRGYFIVVEGLDRAGKSTQVERLAEHLQAKAIKFPERTTAIGQMINSYLAQTSDLDDQAIHLLFSANRWECVASIKKTLDAGESIVCDRYAFSGIAYSVAKGLSYDWCRNPDVGLPLPDLTMFLDLDAQTAAARGGYGEERYEKLEFQAKVRDAFTRVSADVRSHGGRWTTIDASQTLDKVTEDIQRAVQRVTSSIDRVGARLGNLFVSERPPNDRAGSSSELFPPDVMLNTKRLSQSSEDSGRRGKSLDQPRIQINTSTSHGTFPASRPSGSPLSYSEQLAAVRAGVTGTLSGFFSGSSTALDQLSPGGVSDKALPEADGPSPNNATRGQGYDSARVLGKNLDGSGRRRTLIDVIGEIEGQQPSITYSDHRRSMSAAAESTSPTSQPQGDAYPSTFAQAGRVRRSTDHGRVPQVPTINSNGAQPNVAPRAASLTVQPMGSRTAAAGSSPDGFAAAEKPVASPASLRAASFSSATENSLAPSPGTRPATLSPGARTASPAITGSSRSSLASPPPPAAAAAAASTIQRPLSASPADYAQAHANFAQAGADPNNVLSSQHLSMLNMQQGQAEMQEQYMRNYMAMMANPMMAQQAHYQMMLQRQQQQYYGRAASVSGAGTGANGTGGAPSAAFMQPSASQMADAAKVETAAGRSRTRSTHARTPSTGVPSAAAENNAATSTSTSQPMLSMMMAPPPPVSATTSPSFVAQAPYYAPAHMYAQQPMFYAQGFVPPHQQMGVAGWGAYGGRPVYASTRSEIVSSPAGAAVLRNQRSAEQGLKQQYQQP